MNVDERKSHLKMTGDCTLAWGSGCPLLSWPFPSRDTAQTQPVHALWEAAAKLCGGRQGTAGSPSLGCSWSSGIQLSSLDFPE